MRRIDVLFQRLLARTAVVQASQRLTMGYFQ